MPMRIVSVLFLLLVTTATFAQDGDWEVRGRILDDAGRPVGDVQISHVWNANGYNLSDIERMSRLSPAEIEELNSDIYRPGRMEAWGNPTMTDSDGLFSLRIRNKSRLLAIDKERHRGVLIVLDRNNLPSLVEVMLQPLVKVHGKIHFIGPHLECPLLDKPAGQHVICVDMLRNMKEPLSGDRLAVYFSNDHRFTFWLPPGEYKLYDQGAIPGRNVSVTARDSEIDLGIMEVTRYKSLSERIAEFEARGEWSDYTQHYGEKLPEWNIVDTRGVKKDVQLSDYEGKWVILYFWAPSCLPCLRDGLPKLMEFYETHRAHRDKFEILSFCHDPDGEFQSVKQLEKWLEPIVQNAWDGREIPFPLLFDNSFEATKQYGLRGVGHLLLINPEGKLIEGDEKTLAKMLNE